MVEGGINGERREVEGRENKGKNGGERKGGEGRTLLVALEYTTRY